MKSFRELKEEILSEGGEMYPADEMTMKELKIACYAAQNILDRLEDGAMIQRWQISAIVKASDELASVYTSMSADMGMEDDENEMWDDEDEEMDYDEYGYPSMYGEEMDFKVSVDGLPDMYMKGSSPSEVKTNLRKIVKKPDMIQSVDRVTQAMIKKIFRDKASGKEEVEESSFIAKAAHAHTAGEKKFSLKGDSKEYPVTIKPHHARKIKKSIEG